MQGEFFVETNERKAKDKRTGAIEDVASRCGGVSESWRRKAAATNSGAAGESLGELEGRELPLQRSQEKTGCDESGAKTELKFTLGRRARSVWQGKKYAGVGKEQSWTQKCPY
jgi:hypothetical protein